MVRLRLTRSLATLLPALLLGTVLHVHAEAGPRASILTTPDSGCPVCATMGGGMGSPVSVGPLPARPVQAVLLVHPPSSIREPVFAGLPLTRGPPASPPV